MNQALFLDRDGVINRDSGYVGNPADFKLLPGIAQVMMAAQSLGYLLVVITNQSGIARGYFTQDDYAAVETRMKRCLSDEGISLTAIYHCPHFPGGTVKQLATTCDCRKPAPGMILQAAKDLQIDLDASILLGDKPSDIEAGLAAGVADNFLIAPNSSDAKILADVVTTMTRKSRLAQIRAQ